MEIRDEIEAVLDVYDSLLIYMYNKEYDRYLIIFNGLTVSGMLIDAISFRLKDTHYKYLVTVDKTKTRLVIKIT